MMAGNMPYWNDDIQSQSGAARHSPYANDTRRHMAGEGGYQDDDTASQYSEASAYDRNCAAEVSRRIRLLFMEQLYTDVKFVINCGMKTKPTLHAHKAILAIGSDKFREILFDNNSDKSPLEIQINNIPYDSFRSVVEYLYTNEVFFENEVSAMETLTTALKFEIQPLVERCESYIATSELTENNVCTKFQLAIQYKLTSLKNRCEEFIQENTAGVMRSPTFIALNMSTVRTICKMEKLNLRSEMELLEGILRWTEEQPNAKKNKRIIIEPFLRHIRFLTLSCNEFNRFVQNNPTIFTTPEVSNILTSLSDPRHTSNLPSWCNKGTNRCKVYQVPPTPRRNIYPEDQYFHIPLKSSKRNQFLTDLKCVLRLNGSRGHHIIKAIKLSFDHPVNESSLINHVIINIYRESNKFLEEHIRIANSKNIVVRLSKAVLIKPGQSVYLTVEAKDIRNYRLLQYEDNQSQEKDSPFTYSLENEPQNGGFFLISEVIYRKAIRRPPQNQYYRK